MDIDKDIDYFYPGCPGIREDPKFACRDPIPCFNCNLTSIGSKIFGDLFSQCIVNMTIEQFALPHHRFFKYSLIRAASCRLNVSRQSAACNGNIFPRTTIKSHNFSISSYILKSNFYN